MAKDSITVFPRNTGTTEDIGAQFAPDLNKTDTTVWKSFSKYACFDCEAQRQWWNDSGALIARFLNLTNADIHEQYQYLLFMREVIIPALGPYPPLRRSRMNATEIGFEFSLNFQGAEKPVFRFNIDPISKITGTHMDPLNIDTVNSMVARLAVIGFKGFDRTLHHHFTREFFMPEQSMKTHQQDIGEAKAWSQTILGLDFKDGNVVVKQYIWTRYAAHTSGLHPHALIRRAISRVDDQMRCSAAVNTVLDYMETYNADLPVKFFSWDLVDPSKSRLKLYVITRQWSWDKVREVCTLGGKLHGPVTDRSIGLLKRLWDILELDRFTPSMPFTWNYEIRPGRNYPDVRTYFPICDRSDEEVAQAVSQWFELLGWHETASSYLDTLRYLQNTKTAHTWLSVTVTEKGVNTSVYYHSLGNGPDNHMISKP
ncbi:putative DMATS type aromatic prenyltransferase [Aspergillus campestris IBT 28561]|uniref:DMATS type aromatic prenyltransferase n=1 Tax=Aspergillus campestris (strain IBT 28561) TaxID=1392248 RepID=A0A2I1DH52_ASPC2|nr:putative DMATS type aromatic prenyltransferase [Aspergillus campestris IBT 28561]PKY09200.1 putative DMATS type aromatic prenyltransferase [Aspergillus campestris IBT 28561]